MPKSQSDCSSSDSGVVTRSVAVLNQGIIHDKQVTVPCTIKLDKLSQSTEKLQLKDGYRFYILRKAAKQSYKIEVHRVLRTRNQSMPSAIKKSGRMNRPDGRDQRYRYFSPQPNRGSGMKRPLHSPPNEYDKQRRYDNHYRGGFSPRGRGGQDFNSGRPWSRGGHYVQRENRGGYRGHSPGASYGQRSYSSDDSRRGRGRMPSPERYSNRPYRSEKHVTANNSFRNSDYPSEKKKHKSEQDGIQGKSLLDTYQKPSDHSNESKNTSSDGQEKKPVSVQDKTSNKELANNAKAEKAVQNKVESKGAPSETAKKEGTNCLSDCDKQDQGLSKSNEVTVTRTSKKTVLSMSEQIEPLREEKLDPLPNIANSEKGKDVSKKPEDSTTHHNENSCDHSAHGTETSISNNVSARTKIGVEDAKQNVTPSPNRVYSARKSAPVSSLSRTQRKEMLQKQALLKAQNSSETVIPNKEQGSQKAKMGSNSIQTMNCTVNHIDKKESVTAGNISSPVKEAFTPPRSEDIVILSDTEEEVNSRNDVLQSEESSKGPVETSIVDSSAKSIAVTGEAVSTSSQVSQDSDQASCDSKSSKFPLASDGTSDTGNRLLPADVASTKEETESGRDKAEKPVAGENSKDTDKSQSNKLKALQKIRDNLKKNLQKGRTSPPALSPSKTGELPHSSAGSPTPQSEATEMQHANKVERTKESSDAIPDKEPLREVNFEERDVDSQLAQNSDQSSQNSRELVDNVVASLMADDMFNDPQYLSQKDSNLPVLDSTTDSSSAVHELPEIVDAAASKENSPATRISSIPTASAESKTPDDDVSKEGADEVMQMEDETSEKKLGDNPEDTAIDSLSDISVDLGPDEPDDMTFNDDDHLLEDEPEITGMEDFDAGLSGISITRVESQSLDETEVTTQSSVTKRTLPEAEKGEDGMPVSKKSKPDGEEDLPVQEYSSVEGTSEESSEQTGPFLDGDSPVVFTNEEWKEFALSIKEKYEKLVQTFKQKTNEMYEAQARWTHENLLLKEKFHDLKQKYEELSVSFGAKSTTKRQNVEVQTQPLPKTHLSRKKRRPSLKTSANIQSEPTPQDKEADPTTTPSSGTAQTPSTSEENSSAASETKVSSDSATLCTSNAALPKGSNLEAKRQNFRATLSKVIQSKKSVTTTGESGSVPASPSEQAPSPSLQDPSPSNPLPGPSDGEPEEVPMDTTADTSSDEPLQNTSSDTPQSVEDAKTPSDITECVEDTKTPSDAPQCVEDTQSPENSGSTNAATSSTGAPTSAEMPLTQTNAASATSGKDNPASQQPQMNASEPPVSTDTTSKLPSQPSNATSAVSAKQVSSDGTKDIGTNSNSPEINKNPSTEPSTKPPETLASSSKPPVTVKSSSVAKSSKISDVSAEPEIIDLTDDPDPPITSKSQPANTPKTGTPAAKHTALSTRSPHALVSALSTSKSLPLRTATSGSPGKRTTPSAPTSNSGRQTQTTHQNMQGAPGRSGQPSPSAVPPSLRPRSGSTGSSSSGKGSPGVSQSLSPQKPSTNNTTSGLGMPVRSNASTTSAANVQLRNINPPAVAVQGQGSNVRSAVVPLQHGTGQQMASQVTSTQVLPSVQQQSGQVIARTNPTMSVTVVPSQGAARMQTQLRIQQQQQQTQQQISLQMLQQQRQGVHQLPGAAASAAALATRQPQTWLQQQRPVTSGSGSQVIHLVQQQAGQHQQLQMQVMPAHGVASTSASQIQTSSGQLTRQTQAQQQFQGLVRAPTSTQDQIQAQERAHANNQAMAKEKAIRQQREQEQQHAARQAAANQAAATLQANQQEIKRVKLRKLHQEKLDAQKLAQTQQGRVRMLKEQIQRAKAYQLTLQNRLKTIGPGLNSTHFKNIEKQWTDVQDQERKLNSELVVAEDRQKGYIKQINSLDQQMSILSGVSTTTVSPQEQQKRQLQQQQQQLQQQLQKQQVQQQRNRQMQTRRPPVQVTVQQPAEKKHPAKLPDLFHLPDISSSSRFTPTPLCPLLEIKHSSEGIVLSWKMRPVENSKIDVKRYLLYAYQESESATPSTDLWKKIGAVEALPLPMACTLTHFKAGSMYHFAVCAISKHDRPGQFSNIGSINLP